MPQIRFELLNAAIKEKGVRGGKLETRETLFRLGIGLVSDLIGGSKIPISQENSNSW